MGLGGLTSTISDELKAAVAWNTNTLIFATFCHSYLRLKALES